MGAGSQLLLKTVTLPTLSALNTQRFVGNEGKTNTFYFSE